MSVQKRTERLDWDGLRYFQAVAAAGTLTGAARRLRVEHTTVARRLDALEREIGARLFLRNARGWALTRAGESILESVDAIGARVDDVARLAAGEDLALAGEVRVATADLLATHVVTPALAPLLRDERALAVTVVSDTRQHDLTRREADVAVRLGATSEPHLVARRIGSLGFGVYGAKKSRRGDLRRAAFVTFDESVGPLPHDAWLAANAPGARIAFRANRQHTLIEAVRRGIGLGILPCVAGDDAAGLVRLFGPDEVFRREIWIVLHPDLRAVRRIRAVVDAVGRHLDVEAKRLRG